jgi:predicted membrane chloride channel (bestrophin family)
VVPGLLATSISIVFSLWENADKEIRVRADFISHPYAFQLFAYLLGFLMVFRTNFAYNRYWEAIGTVQAMGAKWLDGACMGIVFDAGGSNATPLLDGMLDDPSSKPHRTTSPKGGPVHHEFAADIAHLCSLLHALALQHFRGDSDLSNIVEATDDCGNRIRGSLTDDREVHQIPRSLSFLKVDGALASYQHERLLRKFSEQQLRVLGGLNPRERKALETDSDGRPIETDVRVAMVEGWYMRRLLARQKFEQGESAATSPPILSRLYQVISDGCLWFSHASKIAITPFPFPYHNLISIFLWSYTVMVPFLINGVIMNDIARAVFTFNAVFSYHSLSAVGDNLEDPFFPYDPNELPLQDIQDTINQRLLAFGVTPDRTTGSRTELA